MVVETFSKSGLKAAEPAKLDKSVFGVDARNHQLLKDVYLSYLANNRENLAKAKSRGEVRGGGLKPWRQKGTGRARFGSSRNPIWKGGGVAFGPTGQENYSRKVNQKAKHSALKQALSLAAREDRLKIIESVELSSGKAQDAAALLGKLGAKGKVLLVVSLKDSLVERATRNIERVKVVQAQYVSVFDVLNADHVVISNKALDIIHEWLGAKK